VAPKGDHSPPWSVAEGMNLARDASRYDRQMRISGWGPSGQQRLGRAHLLIAGIGGLGSSTSVLLAAAGIGHLRIVDNDIVEQSNLNRQTVHWETDVGRAKARSAQVKLSALNPSIEVEALGARIDEDSVDDLLDGIDGILDGLDNFPARYLLNDRAFERGIPFFHGSVYGLEGRVTTLVPGRTPCLRCIYPSAPPPGIFPVAGPVPALVGSIQALEAIKFILGIGDLLAGRLLIFDGEDLTFSEIRVTRNPDCPVCGQGPANA